MKDNILIVLLLMSSLVTAQINEEHLQIGEQAPAIQGRDQYGTLIDSKAILKKNSILLVFYRGNWCPYCNKYLGKLQKHLNDFKKKGIVVLLVSPEKVQKTMETGAKYGNEFSILHDAGNKIMTAYKVDFEVNEATVPQYYQKLNRRLAEYNEANNNVLPVPATYLIDQSGKISFVHYDPDYSKRADLEDLLESL